MRNFKIDPQVISDTTVVEAAGCNAITFRNSGTATAYVKGVALATGEVMEISGNECEADQTMYDIRFGSGAANLFVIRKTYVQ